MAAAMRLFVAVTMSGKGKPLAEKACLDSSTAAVELEYQTARTTAGRSIRKSSVGDLERERGRRGECVGVSCDCDDKDPELRREIIDGMQDMASCMRGAARVEA
jgi:hypothetical protein